MPSPLDLLIPPRLIIRAADDLHRMVILAEKSLERLEAMERRTDRMLELGERIDGRADQVLGLGERISTQTEAVTELGAEIEALGRRMLEQGMIIEKQAEAVAARAGELVEALPTIEMAVSMVSPLEGAVERIGRAVDRLPGGLRRPEAAAPEDEGDPDA
jgi:hypothetical protein